MKKRYIWIAILILAMTTLACQFLLPDETPTPPAARPPVEQTATRAVEPPAGATNTPGGASPTRTPPATSRPAATPTGAPSLSSGLIREPVTDADRATAKALAQANPAPRDLRELAIRLRGAPANTPKAACTRSPDYAAGTVRSFSVQNQSTLETVDVQASMRYKNKSVYMWVADKVKADDARIKQAADTLADKVFPANRALLGNEASPGIDCDARISILNTPGMGGAAGYVAGKDAVTKAVRPDSNEMEMFYMSTEAYNIGSTEYLATAAHEFQHVIAGNTHKNMDTWMNEGFSDLAIYVNGFDVSRHSQAFLAAPNTQLNTWDELERSVPHYGASFMFLTYFYNRFGTDGTQTLIADQGNGLTAIDRTLAKIKPGMTADDLFADWQAALYLNDAKVDTGQYAFKDLKFNKPMVERTIDRFPYTATSAVNHWATHYYVLKGSRDVKLSFTGATKARLVGADPRGGKMMWYSGRGDDSVFSLTREFDLSGASSATLKFQTWYNIEEDWDYLYVEASADGGQTWKIIKTPGSTDTNPAGNNYGWALTGASGSGKQAEWVEKSVSLQEFAGKKIQLRFEYITDDALNLPGVALQDIRIPEIAYAYNADSGDGGWQAQGFIRTNNTVPEKYSLQLIGVGADGKTQVQRLKLADDQTGEWTVPLAQLKNAVLVLSALARTTTEPAPYQLRISD